METMFFENLSEVNYIAVLLSVVFSFFLGFVWYSKPVFGKIWMKEIGLDDTAAKKGMKKAMIGAFIFGFIGTAVLATFVGGTDWIYGAKMGAIIGVGIVATSCAGSQVWELRSFNVMLINGVYQAINFTILGAILGAW